MSAAVLQAGPQATLSMGYEEAVDMLEESEVVEWTKQGCYDAYKLKTHGLRGAIGVLIVAVSGGCTFMSLQ